MKKFTRDEKLQLVGGGILVAIGVALLWWGTTIGGPDIQEDAQRESAYIECMDVVRGLVDPEATELEREDFLNRSSKACMDHAETLD